MKETNKKIIAKVWERKGGLKGYSQKLVTIPKESDIERDDYVEVKKLE